MIAFEKLAENKRSGRPPVVDPCMCNIKFVSRSTPKPANCEQERKGATKFFRHCLHTCSNKQTAAVVAAFNNASLAVLPSEIAISAKSTLKHMKKRCATNLAAYRSPSSHTE